MFFLERIMEEHENVLPVVFDWTRDTSNMLVFTKRRDKYTLFRNPQVSNYLPLCLDLQCFGDVDG